MRRIAMSSVVLAGALALRPATASAQAVGTPAQRDQLFAELRAKVFAREAFSPVKEQNLGLDVGAEMDAVAPDFTAAATESDLFYALVKLSNARKDRHLDVDTVPGGLRIPDDDLAAPIRFATDYGTPGAFGMFVTDLDPSWFAAAWPAPSPGDAVVSVNGEPLADYVARVEPYYRYSTLPNLWWHLAEELNERTDRLPPELRTDDVTYGLRAADGSTYEVTVPYVDPGMLSWTRSEDPVYPDMEFVMSTPTYELYRHTGGRDALLLRWFGFDDTLLDDVDRLVAWADEQGLLDSALIIDATGSGGGSHGAEALSRLTPTPFEVTFGNIRLSDVTDDFIESVRADVAAGDTDDADLLAWLDGPVTDALAQGLDYSENVPFKLQSLPADSDGVLPPAPVHFRGPMVAFFGPSGGSHLDQFASMIVDNHLGWTIGMPAGGFSNTWEWTEEVVLPGTQQPLAEFMWSIGQTIRPNGEVLEGNPAQVDDWYPLTAANYATYHAELLERAYAYLDGEPPPADGGGDGGEDGGPPATDAPGDGGSEVPGGGDAVPDAPSSSAAGCGCSTGSAGGGALAGLGGVLVLLRRRRPSR